MIFETRKQIYRINRHALDVEFNQRKFLLQKAIQIDRIKQIGSANNKENVPDNTNETTQQHYDDEH